MVNFWLLMLFQINLQGVVVQHKLMMSLKFNTICGTMKSLASQWKQTVHSF